MRISPLEMAMLAVLARFYVMTREQLQTRCFPDHNSGRSTRKHLRRLIDAGFVSRHSMQVTLPPSDGAAPAYYLTKNGTEALVSHFDDSRYYHAETKTARADRLAHWIAIGWTHIATELAVGLNDDVELTSWVNEWEPINKDDAKTQQYVLHTQFQEDPPLSCSPDAGFALSLAGETKVFYLEQDRATSSPRQIAAQKHRGYAEMLAQQSHRVHFPETTLDRFSVLVVTTSRARRDELAKALSKKEETDNWLFASSRDLGPESLFNDSVFVNTSLTQLPLVKSPQLPEFSS